MDRFLGNIDAKVDAKGRVFVPAVFRKNLNASGNAKLVLRKDIFKDCLILYPENVWEETLNTLRSRLSIWNEEQQDIYRYFVLNSEEMELDSNGRILIPKKYLQMTGIHSEVRFLGIDYTIEVWAKEKIEKPSMDAETFKRGIEKYMQ